MTGLNAFVYRRKNKETLLCTLKITYSKQVRLICGPDEGKPCGRSGP